MRLEWIAAALPWLGVLACPVMMLWMMRSKSGMSCHGQTSRPQDGPAHEPQDAGRMEAEITELRARLADLEAERQPHAKA